jgi:hypothetical protein
MKWIENIKQIIGRQTLHSQLAVLKRQMKACNLEEARHIGIVYDATEPASFEVIRDLGKLLSGKAEKVDILGFVNSKKLDDQYLYRKGLDIISLNDLNWFHKPISPVAEKFIKEPYDLLLNLSLNDYFPILYIVTLSSAAFKAGRFTPSDESLDFMIDIEQEKEKMNPANHPETLQEEVIGVKKIKTIDDPATKTDTEIQLQFLIDQLLHYLSIINK